MAIETQQMVRSNVMRGRDIIVAYLKALKVDYLFGVPGTNEIPIIDGTQKDGPKANGATPSASNSINYIPCLHENIAMGAAMGYARTTGKPGVVMLHVTPGIGHSLGNLFNAYKSHMPILILCGQQHSQLTLQEPLLYSDTVRVAEQYTKWSYEIRTPEEFPIVLQRALKLVTTPPAGPVFLSIPWDYTLHAFPEYQPESARVTRIATNFIGASDALEQAANILKRTDAPPPVILVGDGVGAANAWNELQQVVEKTGAYVFAEGLSSMMNYPPGDCHYMGELPGTQEQMQQVILKPKPGGPQTQVVFLCGFNAQAQIVAYKYGKGPLIPKEIKHVVYLHNDPWEIGKNHYGEVAILGDIKLSLGELAKKIPDNELKREARKKEMEELRNQRNRQRQVYLDAVTRGKQASCHSQDMTVEAEEIARILGELQRDGLGDRRPLKMVLVNEAVSDSRAFQDNLSYDCPTSYFCAEGGSLGYSMPASIGVRLGLDIQGEEERVVVNVVGDGSALFYPHTWWTAYAFDLPILYIITNNKEYRTLQIGLQEVEKLYNWTTSRYPDYLDMCHPPVDFQKIAESFELTHVRIATSKPEEVREALKTALLAVTGKGTNPKKKPYVLEFLTEATIPPTKALEQYPVSIMEMLP